MQMPTLAVIAMGLVSGAQAVGYHNPIEIVEAVAPASAGPCVANNTECRTAAEAAPWIFGSFLQYKIDNDNAVAAVLSLLALESGELQYKRNKFPAPGNPGQGTVNMQGPAFNLQYAKSIPGLAPLVANVTSVDGLPPAELNRILDLLMPDVYNFASAAWFLRDVCGQEVIDSLAADLDQGFTDYMACVRVEADETRLEYLAAASEALELE